MEIIPLLTELPGVSAFSTLAGFNTCTYAGAPSDQTDADMRRLEQHLGIPRSRIHLPLQTHSNRVAILGTEGLPGSEAVTGSEGVPPSQSENSESSESSEPSEPPILADGIAARGRGIAIGVHTADCLPLLLVDPEAQVIAAVHCGWRGTVAGIASNAVSAMISLGAHPDRIVAAFGPHICPRCFEVGPEVAAQFPAESLSPALPSREGALARTEGLPTGSEAVPGSEGLPAGSEGLPAGSEGVPPSQSENSESSEHSEPSEPPKPHVDLAAAVALQLRDAGVTRIHPCPLCSKTDARFYSVRRQGRTLTYRTLTLITLPQDI